MSVTTFTTVNGMILSQAKDGVVNHFVPDPLGSVVMVRDTSGNTVYEAEYDPYGNVQSETGTNPSSLGYVGTLGYIKDSATSMYVRARYLLNNLGRWLTKDPLWPMEPGFVYAGASPALRSDPSGRLPIGVVPGILACAASAAASLIGSLLTGDSPGVAACKATVKCITSGLRAALFTIFGPVAGCIAAAVAAIVNSAADKFCPCLDGPCCPSIDFCDALKVAVDAATGCLGNFAGDDFKDTFGKELGGFLASFINGVTRGALGQTCKGINDFVKA